MKLLVFVEGDTEAKCIPPLVRMWLDRHCDPRVGVAAIKFEGWSDYNENIVKKVDLHLGRAKATDVIGGLGLIDLYGPTFYPATAADAKSRRAWAKEDIEHRVNNPSFRQHLAAHETEAWLLSQPDIFPRSIAESFPKSIRQPETVDFANPPSVVLERLYNSKLKKKYKKIVDGYQLFGRLDLDLAREKCPSLAEFLDDAVRLAGC